MKPLSMYEFLQENEPTGNLKEYEFYRNIEELELNYKIVTSLNPSGNCLLELALYASTLIFYLYRMQGNLVFITNYMIMEKLNGNL